MEVEAVMINALVSKAALRCRVQQEIDNISPASMVLSLYQNQQNEWIAECCPFFGRDTPDREYFSIHFMINTNRLSELVVKCVKLPEGEQK